MLKPVETLRKLTTGLFEGILSGKAPVKKIHCLALRF